LPLSRTAFVGVVISGPNSPAGFVALRYLKGSGPMFPRVVTGIYVNACNDVVVPGESGVYGCSGSGFSEGIVPRPGERWLIYATGTSRGVYQTSTCDGSRRLG
jgi:hypothetical protein